MGATASLIRAKVIGANDLSAFFRSLSGVIDGFGARTRRVAALLRDPATAFEIITSPENFESVQSAIKSAGIEPQVAEVSMVPQNYIKLEGSSAQQMLRLMEAMVTFPRSFCPASVTAAPAAVKQHRSVIQYHLP